MKPYAIARYLTPEQRERAAQADYLFTDAAHEKRLRTLVDGKWICPLGVALGMTTSPDSRSVANRLKAVGRRGYAVQSAASKFMMAVDTGLIRPEDVPASLGVEAAPANADGGAE